MTAFNPCGSTVAVLAALVLAGCTSVPLPSTLAAHEVPDAWTETISVDGNVWPNQDWWSGFRSAELDGLIAAAKANNLDLAAAAARVLQAQAQVQFTRAALFPSIVAAGSAQTQGARANGVSANDSLFGLGVDARYELDFWGLARNNVRAAQSILKSARYAQETVALTVTSAVAVAFLDVLAIRQRIAIARRDLAAAQTILDAVEKRVEVGLTPLLDLAQQQTLVAGQAAVIPALEQQEREARYTLALLLGRQPEGFSIDGQTMDGLAIPSVVPGLPSELLKRRPDVAQAEANLVAANASIAVARAAFFPSIALTVSGGVSSGAVSLVSDGLVAGGISAASGGTGLIYGAGASLLQSIFDAGRRQGLVNLTLAQQDELVAAYRTTVFRAFSDVESSLGRMASLADQDRLKSEQVEKATYAFEISERQYSEGLIDILALLRTQQVLFTAQDELVQIKAARIQSAIGLYKALGGGWSEPATLASP